MVESCTRQKGVLESGRDEMWREMVDKSSEGGS